MILKADYPVAALPTVALLILLGGSSLLSGELIRTPMSETVGTVTRPIAVSLILVYILYLFFLVRSARKNREAAEDSAEGGESLSPPGKGSWNWPWAT